MVDRSRLLDILRLNGSPAASPEADIDKILTALRYTPEDKQKAFQVLKEPASLTLPSTPLLTKPIVVPQAAVPVQRVSTPATIQPVVPVVPVVMPPPVIPPQSAPPVAEVPPPPPENIPPVDAGTKKKSPLVMITVVVLSLILIGSAFGYMYVARIGLFAPSAYTEDSFFSNLLIKASQIKSSSYKASALLSSGPRSKDAQPFRGSAPLLENVQEYVQFMPRDMNVMASVSASSQWRESTLSDWLFNIDVEGSFGDLSYKVNVDALKKENDYFFKVNNIPSLFLSELSSVKGKWIKVSTTTSTVASSSQMYQGQLSYLTEGFPQYEKEYKESQAAFTAFIKKAAQIADEEKLIRFKAPPSAQEIEGKNLVRYKLGIRKEAIVPFYTKLLAAVQQNQQWQDYALFVNEELLGYLQGPEFSEAFDYYDTYTDMTFWTDEEGFPAIMQNEFHLIPSENASQLADKQVNLTYKLVFSDINQPVNIQAPLNFVTIEEAVALYNKSLYGNNPSKGAELKAALSGIRVQAEIVYDESNNSYGKEPFALGVCSAKANTLFGDKTFYSMLEKAVSATSTKATCVSRGTTNKVTSYAISVPLPDSSGSSWCVDATGASKQIKGAITSDTCK